ncbi:MAG TPA: ABC transporter permease [Streptosporangiaceae bacterium]
MSTIYFVIRRILTGIVVLWFVTTVSFLLFFLRPANIVARQIGGRSATSATLALINKRLGLTEPITVQYWHFLVALVGHFNFGYSYYNGESVNTVLAQDLPRTASVVVGGVVLWLVAGLGVGILSATRARSLFDRVSTLGVLAGISLPTFVLGLLLLRYVFQPLNEQGYTWISVNYVGLSSGVIPWMGHMILPWITLATVQAAVYTRLSRGSLLDTMGEDYIRTARAKGLSERRVIYKHGLRSALTPVISQLGVDIGALLGGVIVVENVFNIGGLGQDAVTAISQGNQPVILAFVVIASAFVVLANLIVDVVYAVLDPRVRIA